MYSSKVCVQEFSYFVSDLDIQIEKNGYNSLVQVIDLGRHWGQDLVLLQPGQRAFDSMGNFEAVFEAAQLID